MTVLPMNILLLNKMIRSYVLKKVGGKVALIPSISFYADATCDLDETVPFIFHVEDAE